jgi:hypothetical protein
MCAGTSAFFAADIQPIFTKNCTQRGCHGSISPKEGLQLISGKAYSNLVGVPSEQCSARLRVAAGAPASSYLLDKLTNRNVCIGSQMPKAGTSLPQGDIDKIAAWICGGAKND